MAADVLVREPGASSIPDLEDALALQGFDKHSGKAKDPIPMTNWPYHQLMLDEGFTQRHARRSGVTSPPSCYLYVLVTEDTVLRVTRAAQSHSPDFACIALGR